MSFPRPSPVVSFAHMKFTVTTKDTNTDKGKLVYKRKK